MENLIQKSKELVETVSMQYIRLFSKKIDWKWRLIGILGARGTGKTTLLLQQINKRHKNSNTAIYISLDDIYFTNNRFIDFVKEFRMYGGKYIYVDEAHKYPNWSKEIKNAYDTYKDIYIIFTGSSVIELHQQQGDLSRRALFYNLPGLSFREYILLETDLNIAPIALATLLKNHTKLALNIIKSCKPLALFKNYLQYGYYPFFLESKTLIQKRLQQVIQLIIEMDLNSIEGYDPKNARKVYQLLYILATNVPFKPNISKLSEKINVHRSTLTAFLHYLEKAQLIHQIYAAGNSISTLQKAEKIYLHNTNLAFALAPDNVNIGTLRETFFLNQLSVLHKVSIPQQGDFIIDEKYTIEVGGKDKAIKQLKGVPQAYIAADEMEMGIQHKIPLWMFGLLY